MLVYGDVVRRVAPAAEWAELGRAWAQARAAGPGLPRHSALVQAFIATAELAQGVADAEAQASGLDQPGKATTTVMNHLRQMAAEVLSSWTNGFAGDPGPERPWPPLHAETIPSEVTCKRGEGYAYYALYPEAFGAAARALQGGHGLRVIGLRSIGTGLAAMVAAGAKVGTPLTLRPQGDPFGRAVEPGPDTAANLLADPDAQFAIVDEGPGLSGSSFAGAARWLESRGVARGRIHLFPSHAGEPGAAVPAERRDWWRTARKHCVTFDELVRAPSSPDHRLERWIAGVVGSPEGPLEDLSGGRWRETLASADWPAVNAWQERLKYRVRAGGRSWLAKFSGVDALGAAALPRARTLAGMGFCPEPAGWAHGFLIERWRDDARILQPAEAHDQAFDRRLASYLGFRARMFPAPTAGASLEQLAHMLEINAIEALGPDANSAVESYRRGAAALQRHVRPVVTDNRLHAHEWIVTRDGSVLKTDAIDHAFAHDLVGCQDIAWDVAGAGVEFALSPDAVARLRAEVAAAAEHDVSPDLVRFLTPCYAAFQLGWWSMAANAHGGWPDEQRRLQAAAARYRDALATLLLTSGERTGSGR
ncbi:hypothetical protein [Alsobacter metallidurans]|uniref:hypothetical protein n=1 Tax=Alsobacter metallidurans TaxID=340221 RepID=UPI0016650E49|nr:hypothetical protein [Alsobacter metallidurans]